MSCLQPKPSSSERSCGLSLVLLSMTVFAVFLAARLAANGMWARGDLVPLWPTPRRFLFDLFTWDLGSNGGPAVWPAYAIVGLLWQAGHLLGLPVGTMQALEEAAYHGAAAATAAYLATRLFPGRLFLPLSAGIFYTFNFDWIINSPAAVLWLRVFVPLLLAIYIDFCRAVEANRSQQARWLALGFAVSASVGGSYATINLPQLIVSYFGIVVFAAGRIVTSKMKWRLFLSTTGLLFVTLLTSTWWLSVSVLYYFSFTLVPKAQTIATIDVLQWSWAHARNSFLNLFQLNPFWGWRPEYFSFIMLYSSPFLQILMLAPSIFMIISFLMVRSYFDRRVFAIIGIILCGLFFVSKGLHEPWSEVNQWLYSYIPGIWLLREPYSKLSIFITLFIAILIGYSIDIVICSFTYIPKVSRLTLLPVLVVACTISAFPLLFSSMLAEGTGSIPSGYVRIPNYWLSFAEYISEYASRKVLLLPSSGFYLVPYTWGAYFVDGFLPDRIVGTATVRRRWGYIDVTPGYSAAVEEVYKQIEDLPSENVEAAAWLRRLGRLGIEYLIVQNDLADRRVLPLGSPEPDPRLEHIRQRLVRWGMQPEQVFGALELYHVPEVWVRPRIFAATSVRGLRLDSFAANSPGFAVLEEKQTTEGDDFGALGEVTVQAPGREQVISDFLTVELRPPRQIIFQMLNPAAYRVRVEGAPGPVLLVLQEAYHPLWKVHIVRQPCCGRWWEDNKKEPRDFSLTGVRELGGQVLFLSRAVLYGWLAPTVPEPNHFVADGYANTWLIDKYGDYELLIEYVPQRVFVLGLLVTVMSVLIALSWTIYGSFKSAQTMSS